jgi:hypothetical protein
MTTKEDLKSALNGVYATITVLAQKLSSVVNASDFEMVYRGRIHEIRGIKKFFAGIRPSKYERLKAVSIAIKKGINRDDYRTILECLGQPHTGIPTVAVNVKNCIYCDQELFGDAGNARPAEWQDVMLTVMAVKDEAERVSGQLMVDMNVYYQMLEEERDEKWEEYDFVINPALLDNIGSLLMQLKSLT